MQQTMGYCDCFTFHAKPRDGFLIRNVKVAPTTNGGDGDDVRGHPADCQLRPIYSSQYCITWKCCMEKKIFMILWSHFTRAFCMHCSPCVWAMHAKSHGKIGQQDYQDVPSCQHKHKHVLPLPHVLVLPLIATTYIIQGEREGWPKVCGPACELWAQLWVTTFELTRRFSGSLTLGWRFKFKSPSPATHHPLPHPTLLLITTHHLAKGIWNKGKRINVRQRRIVTLLHWTGWPQITYLAYHTSTFNNLMIKNHSYVTESL